MRFFSKTRGMFIGISFTVLGLAVAVYGLILWSNLRKPAVDLYNTDWTTLKSNQHVTIDMDFLMDEYMIYESGRTNKSMEVTSKFYTVPDLVMDENGMLYMAHFMGVAVPVAESEKYDRLADASYAWWTDETGTVPYPTETILIDGYLRKMSKNDIKYMTEYLQDIGYTDGDINEVMVPYVIMNNSSNTTGLILAGGLMAAIGIGFLIWTIIRIKKDKELMNATVGNATYGSYANNYGQNNDYFR